MLSGYHRAGCAFRDFVTQGIKLHAPAAGKEAVRDLLRTRAVPRPTRFALMSVPPQRAHGLFAALLHSKSPGGHLCAPEEYGNACGGGIFCLSLLDTQGGQLARMLQGEALPEKTVPVSTCSQ